MELIKNIVEPVTTLIGIIILVMWILYLIVMLFDKPRSTKTSHKGLPKCSCKDVNQCTTWCAAKQRFYENPPND